MGSSGAGKRLKLRLFLEGREVPVVGAQLMYAIGGPATATIQIIPTDRGMELLPRTLVHLFFRDFEARTDISEQVTDSGEVFNDLALPIDPQFRLMFCGEIIGFQISKTPMGRQLTLQCMDTSSYWDTTYQMMMTYGPNGNAILGSGSSFLGANNHLFDDIVNDPVSVVASLLTHGKPKTEGLEKTTGLLAGLLRVIEAVGGVQRRYHGANDFNTIAELRLKNLFQIGAEQDDRTSQQIFSRKAFSNWLSGSMGGLGGLVSVRQIINLINSYIYYGVCPNPIPYFVLGPRYRKEYFLTKRGRAVRKCLTMLKKIGDLRTEDLDAVRTEEQATVRTTEFGGIKRSVTVLDETGNPVYDKETKDEARRAPLRKMKGQGGPKGVAPNDHNNAVREVLECLDNAAEKHDISDSAGRELDRLIKERDALPPKGSTQQSDARREEISSQITDYVVATDDGVASPTREKALQAQLDELPPTSSEERTAMESVLADSQASAVGEPKWLSQNLINAREALDETITVVISGFNSYAMSAVSMLAGDALKVWELKQEAIKLIQTYLRSETRSRRVENSPTERARTARMPTQIFRPDAWFASPPRCNVFFPEIYSQVNYSRNYMREITRLQLRTSMEIIGPSALFDNYYYAPKTDMHSKLLKGKKRSKHGLMPHEMYTGIIPKLQRLGEANLYSNQKARKLRKARGQKTTSGTFARNVAEFNFFKTRFAARTMTLSGPFNPYPVVGFPGVVIQRGADPVMSPQAMIDRINENFADIETKEGEDPLFLPTQMVGMVASITHSVSQEGGTTNITFTHVHAHRSAQGSDDEFLNLSIRDSTVATGGFQVSTFLSAEDAAANQDFETLEWLTKLAPQRASDGKHPEPHRGGGGKLKIGHTGPRKGKIVRIETSMVLRDWSPQLVFDASVDEVDEKKAERFKSKVYYTSARIIEKVRPTASQRKRLKKIKLKTPIETALMPPWFSASYYNENIGEKIYQPFYGTGAIVDEQVFQQGGGELAAMTDFIDASEKVQGPNASDSPATDKDGGTVQTAAAVNAAGAQVERTISVQQAVDTLSVIYGHLKAGGDLDINGFVRRYIARPIATMDQVLGTYDFSFDSESGMAVEEEGKVVGVEGFHSRAIADLDKLKGLVDKPGQKLPRLVPSTKQALDEELDPRPGRQERVENYTNELYGTSGSRGLKG